jgi:hypothetical protein
MKGSEGALPTDAIVPQQGEHVMEKAAAVGVDVGGQQQQQPKSSLGGAKTNEDATMETKQTGQHEQRTGISGQSTV